MIDITKVKIESINNPGNSRSISLPSSVRKVLERVILARLNRQLEIEKIVPTEQVRFKTGHSTVSHLAHITQNMKHRFRMDKSTGMILLDLEKAYDSVWQAVVIYKRFRSNVQLCAYPQHSLWYVLRTSPESDSLQCLYFSRTNGSQSIVRIICGWHCFPGIGQRSANCRYLSPSGDELPRRIPSEAANETEFRKTSVHLHH